MANMNEQDREFLKTYNANQYEHPSVAVNILIFTVDLSGKLELLLIKRKYPPFQGCWAIPGGFVNMDESLDEAAVRKLKEEAHIENIHMEQLYTFGDVNRDLRTRVITVAYMALVPKNKIVVKEKTNSADVEWYDVFLQDGKLIFCNDINLAFDHEEIIKVAIERLRGKLSYTDIAFNLLRDKTCFTIYELQKINETILGKELDTPNFRRAFLSNYVSKNMVKKIEQYSDEFSKRPSQCYSVVQVSHQNPT